MYQWLIGTASRLAQRISGRPRSWARSLGEGYSVCPVDLGDGKGYHLVFDSGTNDPIALAYRDGYHSNAYLTDLLPRFTKPGSCVLDLGAHIGTFSLAAAAARRRVIAVDASPHHIDLLRRSAKLNGFKRMRVVHAAVGEHCGTAGFHTAGLWGMVARTGPGSDLQDVSGAPLIEVTAITGDQLLRSLGYRRVDLIKMDIEGSEIAAIRGLKTLLSRRDAPAIAYECNGLTLPTYGYKTDDLLNLLESFGYQTFRVESGRYHLNRSGDFQPESRLDVVALKPRHIQEAALDVAPPPGDRGTHLAGSARGRDAP